MYVTYLLLLGLAILGNCLLIFLLHRHGQKNLVTILLIILLLLVIIWFAPKFLTNSLHPKGEIFEILSRIAALGYIFVPPVFITFTLAYTGYNRILQRFFYWFLLLLPAFIFLFLSWTTESVGVHQYERAHLYEWGYETPTGYLWTIYMFWYDAIMFIAINILIYNYFKIDDKSKKRQMFYIILAVLIPLVVGSITTGILPLFDIFIFPIGLILLNIMAIAGVSIIYRYGWFTVSPLTILSSLNLAIITVDQNSNIIQMNPYSEKMLGIRAPKATGKSVEKVLFVHDRKKRKSNQFGKLLTPVLDKGKSMTFDAFSVLNKKREVFASAISITPIYSDKSIVGANIFLRDTTKEQLRDQLKDDYIGMMSHELKTPITSIKAYNQLLMAQFQNTSDKKRDLVMRIDDQLDRLSALINDFFELSRMQKGKLKLDREFFGIDDFIKGLIELLNITYSPRKFVISGSTNRVVFADKVKIEQTMVNLITNAIKFSPPDKEIVIHLIALNSKSVTIGVQDFGDGIDPRYKKKVFDRFFQVKNTTSTQSGLGIGLFIAQTIVHEHGGKIWVDSSVGKGSTFYFSLPGSM